MKKLRWCPYHPEYDPRKGEPIHVEGSRSEYDEYCTICWGAYNTTQIAVLVLDALKRTVRTELFGVEE